MKPTISNIKSSLRETIPKPKENSNLQISKALFMKSFPNPNKSTLSNIKPTHIPSNIKPCLHKGSSDLQWMREFRRSRTSLEGRVSGEHSFNEGESFARERIYVTVNRDSESKSKRGVWLQE
jgi:hypothetical protein